MSHEAREIRTRGWGLRTWGCNVRIANCELQTANCELGFIVMGLNEGKYLELAPATPLRREQTTEDIGQAVLFLVSEEGRNITGQTLNVDGGRHKN